MPDIDNSRKKFAVQIDGGRLAKMLLENVSLLLVFVVSDALTTILGSKERHINYKSRLNLTCLVTNYPLDKPYILWYKDQKVY